MIIFDYILGKLRLRDAPSGANEKTVAYTIGIFGATGVDFNFASVANALEQSIQLGAAAIIPANSPIKTIVVKCTEAVEAAGVPKTASNDVGNTSGGDEWISTIALETLNQIASVSTQVAAMAAASSIYFSITPGVNWNTLTKGKWKIWITYNDNSTN